MAALSPVIPTPSQSRNSTIPPFRTYSNMSITEGFDVFATRDPDPEIVRLGHLCLQTVRIHRVMEEQRAGDQHRRRAEERDGGAQVDH